MFDTFMYCREDYRACFDQHTDESSPLGHCITGNTWDENVSDLI